MSKQFAPRDRMPPSPNMSAWTVNVRVIPIMAAQGPTKTARSVEPNAWAVVPPTAGMLNICIAKQNAAPMESSGTCLDVRSFAVFLTPTIQKGIINPYATSSVAGLK
jgi:hypothetical protein